MEKDLAEANRLWDAGDKAEAVSKYKSVLNKDINGIPSDAQKPLVYQRVIDFDIEQGNTEAAKKNIGIVLDKNIDIPSKNSATLELIAKVRAERGAKQAGEQARIVAEAKKKEEEQIAEAKRKEGEQGPTGLWKHKSFVNFGKLESHPFHESWEFVGNNRVKIVGPAYKALPATTMDQSIQFLSEKRFQVYNGSGSTRINLFSGFWSLRNGELNLSFNTGDEFPANQADPSETEVKMVLTNTN